MARYGDDTTIVKMLGPDQATAGFSAALEARISAMNEVVSALVEEKTGRHWIVGAPIPSTRVIYPRGGLSAVLTLPVPAASISAVTVDQADEGGVISGGQALDAGAWSVALRNKRGEITALRSNSRLPWLGYQVISVTAVWADTVQSVPADITWLVNYVTAERIKQEQASPAGYVGPDGAVVPIRDPWADSQVKQIIRRHRLTGKGVIV